MGRTTRATSSEPQTQNTKTTTRQSRRLRGSQDTSSPLQALTTPKRQRKTTNGRVPKSARNTTTRRNTRQPTPQEDSSEQELDAHGDLKNEATSTAPTTEPSPPPSNDDISPQAISATIEIDSGSSNGEIDEQEASEDDQPKTASTPNYIRSGGAGSSPAQPKASPSKINSDITRASVEASLKIPVTPVQPTVEFSTEQVRSTPTATPAVVDLESDGVSSRSSSPEPSPFRGSLQAQRVEESVKAGIRARALPRVLQIAIPSQRIIVELTHFNDPVLTATSEELAMLVPMRQTLRDLAHRLTENEKVDIMLQQRVDLVASSERNFRLGDAAADLRVDLQEKDLEIKKLKRQLKKVQRIATPPKGLNVNGKRGASIDEDDEADDDEPPKKQLRMEETANGALRLVFEEDKPDNALASLIFNQPPLPVIVERDEDDEIDNPIIQAVNRQLNAPLMGNPRIRERMRAIAKRDRRRKRIAAGMADEDSGTDEDEAQYQRTYGARIAQEAAAREAEARARREEVDGEESEVEEEEEEEEEPQQASNEPEDEEPQASTSTALVVAEQPPPPQTPSRWGLKSLLGSVFRRTPRTEPPRAPPAAVTGPRLIRKAATPPESPSASRALQAETSAPATPHTGITAADFMPQSAPQPRKTAENLKPRRTFAEAMRKQQEFQAAKLAAEKKKQEEAEERRKAKEAEEAAHKVGEKRKRVRVDDIAVIPPSMDPDKWTYGLTDAFLNQDDDDEDYVYVKEDVTMLDVFTPSPAKKVRFADPQEETTPWNPRGGSRIGFNPSDPNFVPLLKPGAPTPSKPSPLKSSMATPTRRTVIGDPHRATPYTGTMFADPSERAQQFGGANVFNQSTIRDQKRASLSNNEKLSKAEEEAIAYGRKHKVWIGPPAKDKSNGENIFSVPEDSDDESELGGFEKNAPVTKSPEKAKQNGGLSKNEADLQNFGNIFNQFVQDAEKAKEAKESAVLSETSGNSQKETTAPLQPPPPPTPAHASLPAGQAAIAAAAQNDSDALARARSQAEKYKPKTPSGLRAASKLASSPLRSESNTPFANGSNLFSGFTSTSAMKPISNNSFQSITTKETTSEQLDTSNWSWPAPIKFNLPPMDAKTQAAFDASVASPEFEAHVEQSQKLLWDSFMQYESKTRGFEAANAIAVSHNRPGPIA